MINNNKRPLLDDEQLDRLGKLLINASAMNIKEEESLSNTPFLYTRIRARINEQQEQGEDLWLSILRLARLAVPAMVLIAVVSATSWQLHPVHTQPQLPLTQYSNQHSNQMMLAQNSPSCSLTNREGCALSNNELLATVFPQE